MRRILGYTGNDSHLTHHVLARLAGDLADTTSTTRSWGIGYEQESEVLVRKYPEAFQGVDLLSLATDLKTHAFVAFGSDQPQRHRRPEHTEPFRHRSWLGVTVGTFPGVVAERLEAGAPWLEFEPDVPIGHRVLATSLAALRAEGVSLHDPSPHIERLCAAMARTVVAIEEAARQGGVEGPLDSALLMTNGRAMVVGSLGADIRAIRFEGLEVDRHLDVEVPGRPTPRRTSTWAHFRACVVASGFVAEPTLSWQTIAPRAVLAVDEGWGMHHGPVERWWKGI